MNKKIIIVATIFVFFGSLVSPIAFASEVSGILSSNGTLTQGQNTDGTLTGSVVGGNSGGGAGPSYGGGGGGGGGHQPLVSTPVVLKTQPLVDNGNANGVSSDGNALVTFAKSLPNDTGENVSTLINDSSASVTATSDQIAQVDSSVNNTDTGSLLGAQASGAMSISNQVAWVVFGLLLATLVGYGFYRKYKRRPLLK